MTADLRVGLVGPGTIGRSHAAAIAAVPGLSLTAVAGGTPDARASFAVPAFADTQTMLDAAQPDIVVVATPSGQHFTPAAAALLHGCHVLVEKPLCADPGEAERLAGLGQASGLVCATVFQRRLEPVHQHLAAALRSGALGQPRVVAAEVCWWRTDGYYAERPWRTQAAEGGGSLFNQGIHSLDLLLWLFGPVSAVSARCTTLGHALPVEDTTASLLSFASGAVGTLVTTTATPPGRPAALRVFTDRGSLELSGDQVVRWDIPGVPPPEGSGTGLAAQWEDMRAAVADGTPPCASFADGWEAVRVADAVYRAKAPGRCRTACPAARRASASPAVCIRARRRASGGISRASWRSRPCCGQCRG